MSEAATSQASGAPTTPPSVIAAGGAAPLTPASSTGQAPAGGGQTTSTSTTQSSAPASWRDSLPDDLKNDASLALFTTVEALAKSHVSLRSQFGNDKIAVPGKHATPEDWQKVYQKLGLPESVDKYELKPTDGSDANLVKAFKEMMFKEGVLPKQAQAVLNWYDSQANERFKAAQTAQQTALEAGWGEVRKEYGDAFDRQVNIAQIGASEVTDEKTQKWLKESGLDTHPMMNRIFNKVGQLLAEDKIPQGDVRFGGKTPDEIQKEINSVMANKEDPYNQAGHPNHKAALAEMQSRFDALAKVSSGGR
jgi:hypothetical protein